MQCVMLFIDKSSAEQAQPLGVPTRRRFCALLPSAGWALAGGSMLTACGSVPPAGGGAVMGSVTPFSVAREGGPLPPGWRPYILRPDRVRTAYELVRREGQVVLQARAESASSGLHCVVDIDAQRLPWLRWRWRADAVSPKANVADDDAEDTPARLVVAFAGDMTRLRLRDRLFFEQVELFTGNVLPYATLTYVWDGSAATGSVLPYPRSSRIRYQVVESGSDNAGRWLAYERNVLDDYQRIFGEPVSGHISSVGLMTDSDDLKNRAEAWYGDIGLHAEREGGVNPA